MQHPPIIASKMDKSSNSSNCSYYDDSQLAVVAACRAGTGFFSALCCLAMVIVIVRRKEYYFFTKRLILFLAIAAMLHSLSYPLARVNYYTPRYIYDDYCYFGGFYNFYSSWVEVIALSCLTFHMLLSTVVKPPLEKLNYLQYVYLPMMYLLPLIWSWLPFLYHTYATTDSWCDLRVVDENCNRFIFGYIARFALWYGPVYLILFICFLTTLIAVITLHRKVWKLPIDNEKRRELKLKFYSDVLPLVGYPIAYLFLTIFSLANAIDYAIQGEKSLRVLWYLHVLTSPFRGAFIVVVYYLNSETRKQIANSIKHVCSKLASCWAQCRQTGRLRLDYDEVQRPLLSSKPLPNAGSVIIEGESKLTRSYGSQ